MSYEIKHSNGSVILKWELPPELEAIGEGVLVEVNVTGEWVPVGSGAHSITSTAPAQEEFPVHLRVSVKERKRERGGEGERGRKKGREGEGERERERERERNEGEREMKYEGFLSVKAEQRAGPENE